MLRRYVEQLLNIYNYIDGIMITDKDGYVEYYQTFRPDVNNLKEQDVLHKHITEIYPDLDENTSSLMRVLKTGHALFNEYQTLKTYKGQSIRAINSTMPIKNKNEIIGAVDVSRYIDFPYQREDITIEIKNNTESKSLYTVDDIITNSQSMDIIKKRIPMIADTDSSVLIYGETGTGKELVAQSIHSSGKRKYKRFISQNCAAIPGNLLESILFGTTKGSYTGAENKPGLFEVANGGTLFLDEINSMEISVQTKLLKAIEEKKITRLGSYKPVDIDVKIISAVNEMPIKCIEENKLREDLFYRLSVVQLNIPPLRERINDLFFLVSHFIEYYNKKMGKNIINIEDDVEKLFRNYSWPGNVRELKNVIEGAFNIASSRFIQYRDLPEYMTDYCNIRKNLFKVYEITDTNLFKENPFSLDEALGKYEKMLIMEAISHSDSLVEAASILGITKQSLNYKLLKYELKCTE